nr:AAA family ATPase [Bacillus sp. EB600]
MSEGEKTFITFLYFYHLIKGSNSTKQITVDKVIVIDDPISSLDSDILFIVSCLIRKLIDEIREDKHTNNKQLIILTHNVFFQKQKKCMAEHYETVLKNRLFGEKLKQKLEPFPR